MLKRGFFNFLLLAEFTHSIQRVFNNKTNDYSAVMLRSLILIPGSSSDFFHFGKHKSEESQLFKNDIFAIVGADADTKILLVGGVKLASVVTTSFEQKKHGQITS